MATPQKPDCFVDQAEADTKALAFLEGVARYFDGTLPGITIEHWAPGGAAEAYGRVSFVWAHGQQRLLALAVVTRNASNHSLLVTKQFQ